MKFLIVGLGNIGSEYINTRHNIGFDIADTLASKHNSVFQSARLGSIAKFKYRGRQVLLLKPATYMNLSGKAIKYWVQKEKIDPKNLLVIVDDINISFGTIRLRGKGNHGGHNGLKDIIHQIGSTDFARLRWGIGSEFSKGRQIDFVLGKWDKGELPTLDQFKSRAADACLSYVAHGLANTMNKFNG